MASRDTRTPLVLTLVFLFLCVGAILIAGYFHGHMNLPAVLKNLHQTP